MEPFQDKLVHFFTGRYYLAIAILVCWFDISSRDIKDDNLAEVCSLVVVIDFDRGTDAASVPESSVREFFLRIKADAHEIGCAGYLDGSIMQLEFMVLLYLVKKYERLRKREALVSEEAVEERRVAVDNKFLAETEKDFEESGFVGLVRDDGGEQYAKKAWEVLEKLHSGETLQKILKPVLASAPRNECVKKGRLVFYPVDAFAALCAALRRIIRAAAPCWVAENPLDPVSSGFRDGVLSSKDVQTFLRMWKTLVRSALSGESISSGGTSISGSDEPETPGAGVRDFGEALCEILGHDFYEDDPLDPRSNFSSVLVDELSRGEIARIFEFDWLSVLEANVVKFFRMAGGQYISHTFSPPPLTYARPTPIFHDHVLLSLYVVRGTLSRTHLLQYLHSASHVTMCYARTRSCREMCRRLEV